MTASSTVARDASVTARGRGEVACRGGVPAGHVDCLQSGTRKRKELGNEGGKERKKGQKVTKKREKVKKKREKRQKTVLKHTKNTPKASHKHTNIIPQSY